MIVHFTSREFRSQQAHVFELADQGQKVIIRRNKKQSYMLVPVGDEDLTITPELQAKIDKAREEYRQHETLGFDTPEALNSWLESL